MSTLTWITEKELERVIKNKVNEFRGRKALKFHSDSEKMRNASGQQGENKQQWKSLKPNRNTKRFFIADSKSVNTASGNSKQF